MMQRSTRAGSGSSRPYSVILGMALLSVGTGTGFAPVQRALAEAAPPSTVEAPKAAVGRRAVPSLDRRLQALTRELGLDAGQQARVREILTAQREAVRRIWVDPAVPPVERAAATQAQTERTGDDIRAILNDAQKKIYNRARNDSQLSNGDKRSVEQWMDASQAPRPGLR